MRGLYKFLLFSLFILVGFFSFSSISYASLSLDSNFGNSGKITTSFGNDAYAHGVVAQSDEKFVTVGYASDGNHYNWAIVRYNTDGSIDKTFGNNGKIIRNFGFNSFARGVALQPNGKILVGGSGGSYGGWTVERYNNNDGSLDITFGVNGTVETPIFASSNISTDGGHLDALMLQSDGKIVTAGYIPQNNDQAVVIRYNPDGSLDQTFGLGGIAISTFGGYGRIHAAALQLDGKIVVFGDRAPGGSMPSLLRFNSNGSLDQTLSPISDNFANQAGAAGMTIQSDGKIIIVGQFVSNDAGHAYAIRYNPNGSRDVSFGNNGLYASMYNNDRANSIIVQSDGKVVIGGGDGNNFKLTRLNSDGVADSSFGSNGSIITQMGSGYNDIQGLILHSDRRILTVGGLCNSYCDWTLAQYRDTPASLNVPLLKQTANPWAIDVYDSANIWSPANPNFSSWGCAVTSAAMIFQYYGLSTMSDNSTLDPKTLNNWLKSQPDGYIRNGLVNWLALGRLSQQLARNGKNQLFHNDALEFSRINTADKITLTSDIQASQPDILEEPGHFIVAKGIHESTFDINDPYYNRSTLNDGYNNSFSSLLRYSPTNTDLSFIFAVVNPEVHVTLKNVNGTVMGEEFVQQPILNPLTNNSAFATPLNTLYVKKPDIGQYTIAVTSLSPQIYSLNLYLYDNYGVVQTFSKKGLTGPGVDTTFNLSYVNYNNPASSLDRTITFDSTIQDITLARAANFITSNHTAKKLIESIQEAKRAKGKNRTKEIREELNEFIKTLGKEKRKKHISEDAYQILLEDATYLINHL